MRGSNQSFVKAGKPSMSIIGLSSARVGELSNLLKLAEKYPDNSEVHRVLAKGYAEYEDHEKAAEEFAVAASKAKSKNKEFDRLAERVLSLLKIKKKNEMYEVILKMKNMIPQVDDGEARIIKTLRKVAEDEGEDNLFYGLTERLLQLKPDDIDARFNLAYKYSQTDEDDLSLYHYLRIPYQERSGIAWNNLGVQYNQLGLVRSSIQAYRKAEGFGETLAMSNIANKFLKEGFLTEAQEICTKALANKEFHNNVSKTISRIKDIPEEEEKKEKQIVTEVLPFSEFYRDYGRAALLNGVTEMIGRWQGPDCELEVTIKGNRLLAEGRYEEQEGTGLRGLFSLANPGITTRIRKYRVRYEGTVVGKSVKCVLMRGVEGEPAPSNSLLSLFDKGIDVQ